MSSCVADSSAVLAVMFSEPGGAVLSGYLPDVYLCSVNCAEVITKLCDHGMLSQDARAAINGLGIQIIAFDEDLAVATGDLRAETRAAGLSLGDRACLALAQRLALPALTTDKMWARVPGHNVVLIR